MLARWQHGSRTGPAVRQVATGRSHLKRWNAERQMNSQKAGGTGAKFLSSVFRHLVSYWNFISVPQSMSWMPPKGLSIFLTLRAMYSSCITPHCPVLIPLCSCSRRPDSSLEGNTPDLCVPLSHHSTLNAPTLFENGLVACAVIHYSGGTLFIHPSISQEKHEVGSTSDDTRSRCASPCPSPPCRTELRPAWTPRR